MVALNTVRSVKLQYGTEGAEKFKADALGAAAASERMGQAVQQAAVVTEQSARRQLSAARDYDKLRQSMDAAYKAQVQFARAEATINRASGQGHISTVEREGALAAARARYLPGNDNGASELTRRADRLRAELDPLAASQQRLARTTAEADELFKAGALTQAEHTRLVEHAAKAHTDLETRVGRSARTAALSANDWRNLSFQLNDATTMALSGSSAFQIVATQGGQVFQVLQGANGGIRGALAGLVSPAGIAVGAIGAVTAAVLAGAAAYDAFDKRYKNVERSLLGSGRASGLTSGDVVDIARRSPLPIGTSEELAAEFARTGNATARSAAKGLSTTRDLAASMGTDFASAGKLLVGVFEDPTKALDKLNERFRFLSTGQRQYISDLQNQGRASEAVAYGLDALSGRLGRYNDTVSTGTRLSDNFTRNWQEFKASIGEGVASLFGDPRADTLGGLKKGSAELGAEMATLQRRLVTFEDARKNAFGGGVSESTLDMLYPVAGIRRRIDEIVAAQEDLSRRTSIQLQARTTAQRIAAQEEQRAQADRITTVVSGLQRQNASARLNPVDRQVREAEREAGIYRDRDMATGLAAEAERLSKTGPTLTDGDRRGSSSLDPIVRPGSLPPIVPSMTRDRFGDVFKATNEQLAGGIRSEVQEGARIAQRKQLEEISKASAAAADAEAAAIGKSVGAAETLRAKTQLRLTLGSEGRDIDRELTRELERQAEAMGRIVQQQAERRMMSDLEFQRAQLTRTPAEATIAATLRPVYGDDTSSPGYRMASEYQRATLSIMETQRAMSALGQMGNTLIDPLLDSTRSWGDAFGDLTKQMARAALQASLFGQGPFAGAFGTAGAGAGLGGLAGATFGKLGGMGEVLS